MKRLFFLTIITATIFLFSCTEEQRQGVDRFVQDVNNVKTGAEAVLKSPAGAMIPPPWGIYGVLGVQVVNGLVIAWQEWRNRTMKKTTRAIVKGIEKSANPDNPTVIKENIADEMVKAGGDKFYARANKIVDKLKIS